jgi:hypothetical protein
MAAQYGMTLEQYTAYCEAHYAQYTSNSTPAAATTSDGVDGGEVAVVDNKTSQQSGSAESSSSNSGNNSSSSGGVTGTGVLSSYLTDLLQSSSEMNSGNEATAAVKVSSSSSSSTATITTATATPTVDSTKDTLLPFGWAEYIDDDTGATYYYHAESGESSWDLPTAAVV